LRACVRFLKASISGRILLDFVVDRGGRQSRLLVGFTGGGRGGVEARGPVTIELTSTARSTSPFHCSPETRRQPPRQRDHSSQRWKSEESPQESCCNTPSRRVIEAAVKAHNPAAKMTGGDGKKLQRYRWQVCRKTCGAEWLSSTRLCIVSIA